MVLSKHDEEISWNCWLRTILVGGGATLLLVFVGMNEAQSSVLLPQLKKADSFIRVTPDEETWIASLGLVMAPVSAICIGPFIDAFGRKKGLQFFYLVTGLGYAVMAYAREVYQVYVGRTILGIGAGLLASGIVYLVEICSTKQREYYLSLTSALFAIGMTLMSVIGGYLPWHVASLIFSVFSLILFVTQFFVPESPPWLFKMGKEDAAIQSFQVLGRTESDIQRELDTLRLQCKDNKEKVEWRTFLEPTVWKPFVIMVTLFYLQNWSGIVILFYYSVDFVEKLGTIHDPLSVTVSLCTARLLTSCTFCIFFRSKVGRKFAVAFSGFCMAVTYGSLSAYQFAYHDVEMSKRPIPWLPEACLIFYVAFSVLGVLGLPYVMCGEVYPLKVRGTLTSVTHALAWIFMFLVVKTYSMSMEVLQMYSLLLLYAGVCLAAGLFAIFVLPETQNKSLLEIEQGFLPKKRRQLKTDAPQITKL